MEEPFIPLGYEEREYEVKQLLADVAREFEAFLPQIFYTCDASVGLDQRGKAASILHPVDFDENGQKVKDGRLERAVSTSGQEDEFFELLSHSGSPPSSPPAERASSLVSLTPSGSFSESLDSAAASDPATLLNEKVVGVLRGWFDACTRSENTQLDVDGIISSLYVSSKKPNVTGSAGSKQFDVIIQLLEQLMKLIPFLPTPELLGGQCFIGSYLIHSSSAVSNQVSISLQKVFIKYPQYRLG